MIDLPSPNWNERPASVDMLILHYTGMQSAAAAIDRLRDPVAKVSSHYVIDEDGTVYRLVPEERRAFHAGVSFWAGRTNLNDVSVGIELVNPGHEWGYRPFPEPQMTALEELAAGIVARHAIPPARVLGHSDVAPDRKQDPGELFDWRRLAAADIGLWPEMGSGGQASNPVTPAKAGVQTSGDASAPLHGLENGGASALDPGFRRGDNYPDTGAIAEMQRLLRAYGYGCPDTGTLDEATRTVLVAFQRHFRPGRVDGLPDADCATRLRALLQAARL